MWRGVADLHQRYLMRKISDENDGRLGGGTSVSDWYCLWAEGGWSPYTSRIRLECPRPGRDEQQQQQQQQQQQHLDKLRNLRKTWRYDVNHLLLTAVQGHALL